MVQPGSKIANETKSIAVIHRHALIREGIARILQEASFHIVGQEYSSGNLLQLLAQHKPDIMLLDWEIPEVNPTTIHKLIENRPQVKIVILTEPHSTEAFLPAMQAGAGGYLSVNLSPQECVQSLHALARGDIIVSQEMVKGVKGELAATQSTRSKDDISDREREVLQMVGRGATNREIAQRLIVSEHTVKVHLRNILNKLTLRNRQQIAAYAVQEGLVIDVKSEDSSHLST
jgi:DNA-binding NarL/FixJ family response regulator